LKKFYDVKIKRSGADGKSRYLTVTKILPKDWEYVRVWEPTVSGNTAVLRIECLYKAGGSDAPMERQRKA
jgi:hypothetical protein